MSYSFSGASQPIIRDDEYPTNPISHPTPRPPLQHLLLPNGAKIVVAIHVVTPPRREGMRAAAGAEDGKGQDEEDRQAGAVEGAGDEVRVVPEDSGAVVAEVELDEEATDELAEDDAGLALVVGDVAGVLDELRHVDVGDVEVSDLGDELWSASDLLAI